MSAAMTAQPAQSINIRHIALATFVPVAVMLIALYWRPIWRDEAWALFMSDPSIGLGGVTARSSTNVHPPFYFYMLHIWRLFADGILLSKSLNLALIIIGIFAALRIGKAHRMQTYLFLLFCAGSYWLIYFTSEIRPYALMFIIGTLSVLAMARILQSTKGVRIWPFAMAWAVLSAAACLTHYFSFIWTGAFGLLTGLAMLKQGRAKDFVIVGAASVAGIIPGLLFLANAYGQMGIPPGEELSIMGNLAYGFNQFQRGMVTKLFGSNLALAIIFFMSIAIMVRRRKPVDIAIGGAVILTVTALFIVHIVWQPVIKERSFIIIIPAMIFLMTRAVMIDTDGKWRGRVIRALPLVIAITPLLFVTEYFKDREQMSDVRALLSTQACRGADITAYYRPAPEGEGFNEYYTRLSLDGLGVTLIDSSGALRARASDCPIKALALQLPRGEKDEHSIARAALSVSGVPVSELEEISVGKGRNLLYRSRP
ncbi:hypothetical protein [Robiginitomaculum antarcticum]|uniref:hypothetical protein n=1 Tax=Robiginitomaculum antarcticum TaxID=437507 RepID=UPI0003653D5C|nr:hypothetical protein [Robiginitomaculum antarcticum]